MANKKITQTETPGDPSKQSPVKTEGNSASGLSEQSVKTVDELTIGSASAMPISTPSQPVDVNAGLTKVKISYPENYKGIRHFTDGEERYMARETADQFVELGFAIIVE